MAVRSQLALLAILFVGPVSRPESPWCGAAGPLVQSQTTGLSLYCIPLIATSDFPATGIVEMRRVPGSPFTVSVDQNGHALYQLELTLNHLPTPRSLGPYSTYVAWATTANVQEIIKIGEVHNGSNVGAIVGLNRFIVTVTAEPSARATRPTGRQLLNGTSPSWRLEPHDAPPPLVDATPLPARPDSLMWMMPPMHPHVPAMSPGLEALVPGVAPWLPRAPSSGPPPPMVKPSESIDLRDGDSLNLTAAPARQVIGGREAVVYAYNGQWPGPRIRVAQQSAIIVNFTNNLDQPTSIHWHGVRLDNPFDGSPHVTQELVPPGGHFRYVVHTPDAGVYWYHPHVREDAQQDLGLYGNLIVTPTKPATFNPVDRDEPLMLDDLLLDEEGHLVPYGLDAATHALMGRFGNHFLVNGLFNYTLRVDRGQVVRFSFTNASSTRVFNLSLPGARMKLVGGDLGLVERESWLSSVVIAPAERYIVEARFDSAAIVPIVNHVQAIDHYLGRFFDDIDTLGIVTVNAVAPGSTVARGFETLRVNADVQREVDRYRSRLSTPPDHTLELTLQTRLTLPFALYQALRLDPYAAPVEWSGTMPMMDWLSTSNDVQWVLRDEDTGRENMDIGWHFRVGDLVHLRLVNDTRVLHPMQHSIHIHGQRFLILAVNGEPMETLMWKDTALIPTGSTVDLLVEMSNPGEWMLHCHIAEHLESGMHMVFEVTR